MKDPWYAYISLSSCRPKRGWGGKLMGRLCVRNYILDDLVWSGRLDDSRLALWTCRSWLIHTKMYEIGAGRHSTFLLSFKFGFFPNFWCKRFPCVMSVMKYSVISLIWLSDGNNVTVTISLSRTVLRAFYCWMNSPVLVEIASLSHSLVIRRSLTNVQ